jgi:hypothetical protein
MEINSNIIALSAFSGLIGAVLTQTLTGIFGYLGDHRKSKFELNKLYRDKQVEVAEHFYYVTGETMAMLKRSVEYWKDKNKSRSEDRVEFFKKEMRKLDGYMEKLNSDNWKHNLIGLYFNVSLSQDELIKANNRSHSLYLRLLDIADRIKKTQNGDKEKLIGDYQIGIFDLCSQYDDIYIMLEHDMNIVKAALSRSFQISK